MRIFRIFIFCILVIIFGCNSKNSDSANTVSPQKNQQILVDRITVQESEDVDIPQDQTNEIYYDINNIFSGSWKDEFGEIDGERVVSWGAVPFSNQSYFIIDFQNENRIIIKGSSEGGKKGFDFFVAEILKISMEQDNIFRFTYIDKIDTLNPRRKHDIVLKYYPDEDKLSIIEYYGSIIDKPLLMTRISKPISNP